MEALGRVWPEVRPGVTGRFRLGADSCDPRPSLLW